MAVVRFAVVTGNRSETDTLLAASTPQGVDGVVLEPTDAIELLEPGDVAVGRLDVLETLDGIDEGLWCLGALGARGVTVLNPAACLLATHDKLLTARLLRRNGVPHPVTAHVRPGTRRLRWSGPAVLKPRHGSWGTDVLRADTAAQLSTQLALVADRAWFVKHGALVQALVTPVGYDLRLVVAAGEVVGAARRDAAPGEWRTNVALGARRTAVGRPPGDVCDAAVRAAHAVGGHLVGVDLLPTPDGGWTVVEVNGAVQFNDTYGDGVHARAVARLLTYAMERRVEPDELRATAPD